MCGISCGSNPPGICPWVEAAVWNMNIGTPITAAGLSSAGACRHLRILYNAV